ncbi:MAG TPA: retron St85 family effector protein [Candidatus Glassbacteria bacterium]|nr:retron St85 family effector protein [Candidatus Glassbacteria bacterium]
MNNVIPIPVVKKLLKQIYIHIFKRDEDFSLNIFLCGAKMEKQESLRAKLYKIIKNEARLNIAFPEFLFSNLLSENNYNLLTLEKELAKSVDVIVLPIESLGTIAELGSFASFRDLTMKIIVINDEKYKLEKSFINMGPLSLIKSQNKKNVIYYNDSSKDAIISSVAERLKHMHQRISRKDVKNLFNLSRFLLYTIALMQPVTRQEIELYLKEWRKSVPILYVDPCLELLCTKNNIEISYSGNIEKYCLTSQGHNYVFEKLFRKMNIIKEFSALRSNVLEFRNRKEPFDISRAKGRYLV